MAQQILIGTSGSSYDDWKGYFYPRHLSDEQMLAWYAGHFRTTEINTSFYRLPARETLKHWCDLTPADFLFAVKASRYITHLKKLRDPGQTVSAFLQRIRILGDKLGPILFQLPPHRRFNRERLAAFLDALSREFRYAFEFRDRSWLNEETRELLARHGAVFCIYELDGFLSPKEITSDLVCVSLHGPGEPYQGTTLISVYPAGPVTSPAGRYRAMPFSATSTMMSAALRCVTPCACRRCCLSLRTGSRQARRLWLTDKLPAPNRAGQGIMHRCGSMRTQQA